MLMKAKAEQKKAYIFMNIKHQDNFHFLKMSFSALYLYTGFFKHQKSQNIFIA